MLKKLLLIDSDQEILDAFKRFLEIHRYSVSSAASGEEAIRQLQLDRPHLMVIEPALRDQWGERILDEFQHVSTGVPVIGVSKCSTCSHAFLFNDYLIKPISLFLLLESIRAVLQAVEQET